MKDPDSQMLFEAYRKIYEAPIDPGGSWGDEDASSKFDKGEMESFEVDVNREGCSECIFEVWCLTNRDDAAWG